MRLLHNAFRLYIDPSQLEKTIAFYEELQDKPCERRISFADRGIKVAVVGAFILLAGSEEVLAPLRETRALIVVDSLDETIAWLKKKDAVLLHEPHDAAGGRNVTARNPDGLVAEYFEPGDMR